MARVITKRPKVTLTKRQQTVPAKWAKILSYLPRYDSVAMAPPGHWFDTKAAQLKIDFFPECLTHVKGDKGKKPFVLSPWLKAITAAIYGWKTPEGLRQYQEILLYVPKGNAKTMWAAGIVVGTLISDPEPGIEAYSAASDTEQAGLTYHYVRGMIEQDPFLTQQLTVYKTFKSVQCAESNGTYRVLSGKPRGKDGTNAHLVINDELQAHPSPELIEKLTTGTGKRSQPLIIHTTTADWLRESYCNEKYTYACNVRDGVIEDSRFLPIIYEATPPADIKEDPLWWTKEKAWYEANPHLGESVKIEYFQRECQRAIDQPRYRNTFLRNHLNVRTGQDVSWFGLEAWDACFDETLSPDDLIGERCFGGFDGASVHDLSAFVLWFPAHLTFLSWFWLPSETAIKRFSEQSVPYPQWIEEGHILTTPGNVTDLDYIRDMIDVDITATYNVIDIGIDRWNTAHLQTQLTGLGHKVVPYAQTFGAMSPPSKELEKMIVGRTLRHNGNPVMRWMASHVATDKSATDDIKPTKERSAEKIDGFTALVMAIGRAIVTPEENTESVYEHRGLLTL